MKKFFGCLILGLLIGSNLGAEPCLVIYRPDLQERWVAYNGSSLCTLNKTSQEDFKYGLQNKNGQLMVSYSNYTLNATDSYTSEKGADDFSFSLLRWGADCPNFITITETSNSSLQGTFEHTVDNSTKAHRRTRYYVEPGAMVKEGSSIKYIMLWTLCIIEALILVSAFVRSTSRMGNAFHSVLLIGLSLLTGWVNFYSTFWFTFWLFILVGLALGVGLWVNHEQRRFVSIMLGLWMIVYYFYAWVYECKWFFFLAVPLILAESAAFGLMRHHLPPMEKVAYTFQSAIFWIQVFLFWSFVFTIYPPEIYLRYYKGPTTYPLGVKGKGFTNCGWPMIVLIFVLALEGVAGFLRILRDRHDYIDNKHKDQNLDESRPMVDQQQP